MVAFTLVRVLLTDLTIRRVELSSVDVFTEEPRIVERFVVDPIIESLVRIEASKRE